MTLRTHRSNDFSQATVRIQRACYHTKLDRLYDCVNCEWTGTWACECGYVFDEVSEIFKGRMGNEKPEVGEIKGGL